MTFAGFFDSGVVIRVAAVFTNSAGTAVDPTTVKFSYRADALAVTTTLTNGIDAALVKSSTGNYYVDVDSRESSGQFDARFFATGTNQASSADIRFYVRPSPV